MSWWPEIVVLPRGVRDGLLLDEVAMLNTDTMTWSALEVGDGDRPGPRRCHAAASLPGRVKSTLRSTLIPTLLIWTWFLCFPAPLPCFEPAIAL